MISCESNPIQLHMCRYTLAHAHYDRPVGTARMPSLISIYQQSMCQMVIGYVCENTSLKDAIQRHKEYPIFRNRGNISVSKRKRTQKAYIRDFLISINTLLVDMNEYLFKFECIENVHPVRMHYLRWIRWILSRFTIKAISADGHRVWSLITAPMATKGFFVYSETMIKLSALKAFFWIWYCTQEINKMIFGICVFSTFSNNS